MVLASVLKAVASAHALGMRFLRSLFPCWQPEPAGLLAADWAAPFLPLSHPSTPSLLELGTQEPVGLVPALPNLGN